MQQAEDGRAAYAEELRRILNSIVLRNSEASRRLLEYLGREALTEQPRELKEYTVGVEAFGKPPDYDPKLDSSVRVQAGKLRQRLEEYYRTEGRADPVVVSLPKGRFRLQMQTRASPDVAEVSPKVQEKRPLDRISWLIAAFGIVWAAVATGYAWWRTPVGTVKESPYLEALWSPLLESSRPTLISLGTPLFAKISGDFYRSPTLNSWKAATASQKLNEIERVLQGPAMPAFPYTGIGEAWGACELTRMFLARRKDVRLVLNSTLSWEDIRTNNVIFLGPPKFNSHESELPVTQDFVIELGRLENLHPKPGEQHTFSETWASGEPAPVEGYALIARLPGLHKQGLVMELASTSTEGTRAAVEYVTRPEYAINLVRSLRKSSGNVPNYFEAVIRAKFRSQTPIEMELVAVHVLSP